VKVCAVSVRNVLVPVESVAVSTVPLEDRLVVQGVLMTGEGPLVAEVVEEVEDVWKDVGVDVVRNCPDTVVDDEVLGLD
jgi:hypothetical protein